MRIVLSLVLLAIAGSSLAAPKRDLDLERVQASLASLERDPALGELAAAERLQARQALQRALEARRDERVHRTYLAERRVDIAYAVAQAELAARQLDQLARERDRILLDASRREAELSRLEAEKQRLQSMARAEEAERAQQAAQAALAQSEVSLAEAEQSRRLAQAQSREMQLARREAELAMAAADSLRLQLQGITARRDARGEVMTLSGEAFASGAAQLRPEARANLGRVVEFVQSRQQLRVRIEGHTDSRGSANLNQALSQRRAEAVRQALIEEGVDAGRLVAIGLGLEQPVADNASESGRARNRRVEIVLLDAQ